MRRAKPQHHPGVLYVRNVPPALKTMFKAEVIRRGLMIEDVIPILLEAYLKDPAKFPARRRGGHTWEAEILLPPA